MRKLVLTAVAAATLVVGVAGSASAAPGQDIRTACGASFGQLIGPAKASGTAAHMNYAGGAAAFSDPAILAAHGCTNG
jgi:hypothetical protein